jgi:hypothetical protein
LSDTKKWSRRDDLVVAFSLQFKMNAKVFFHIDLSFLIFFWLPFSIVWWICSYFVLK